MNTAIDAVLFDADGVIQRRPTGWRDALGEMLGFNGDPGEFLADMFAAEDLALSGQCDFRSGLSNVLIRWDCRATLDDALQAWTMIEVDRGITDTIRTLRQMGVRCYLASNQELCKAAYMSRELGYCELFEREFYSCRLGLMKPDGAYFRAIVREIGLPPEKILFIDDRQHNVDSARGVGLHAVAFELDDGPDRLNRILNEYGLDAGTA